MSFPTVSARQTGASTGSATSHAITLPTHAANDLILVMVGFDGIHDATVNTGSSSVGWSSLNTAKHGVGGLASSQVTGSWLWLRAASASETLTLTTSSNTVCAWSALAFTPGALLEVKAPTGTSITGSSTNANPPAHYPSAGIQDYVWVAMAAIDLGVEATAPPSGFSNLQTDGAGFGTVGISTAEYSLNGLAVDPGTFSTTSEQWVCWTISVYEGAPGGGGKFFMVM